MLAIRRMKARKKKAKKKKRKKGQKIVREREQKSLGIVGPCVCGFSEVAPPTFSFHERFGEV